MKPTELRIGNLVKYNGKIVGVRQITQKKIGYHLYREEHRMNYARLCEVEPVPISEDNLIDNGFFNQQGEQHYLYHVRNSSMRITRVDHWIWKAEIFAHNPINVCSENVFYIRYIHELQNLYQLVTGKNIFL